MVYCMEHENQNEINYNILKSILSDMIENVRINLSGSIESLEELNVDMANEIIVNDEIIDRLQKKIERQVINYVTRFQPLDKDLRYIISLVKFANDLERIGDLAVNIAKTAKKHKGILPSYSFINIRKMIGYTEKMIKDIIDAYYKRDIEKAKEVYKMDKKVDNLYKHIRKNIAYEIKEEKDKEKVAFFLDLILVSRYLERAADHAKNIASEIHYVEVGISLKEVTL